MTNKASYLIIVNAFFILTHAWAEPQTVTPFDEYLEQRKALKKAVEIESKTLMATANNELDKLDDELKAMVDQLLGPEKFREKVQTKDIYLKGDRPEGDPRPEDLPKRYLTGVEYRFEKSPSIFVTDTRFKEIELSASMPEEEKFFDPQLDFAFASSKRLSEIENLKSPGFDRVWASIVRLPRRQYPDCGQTLAIIARRGTRIYAILQDSDGIATKPLEHCMQELTNPTSMDALKTQINNVLSLIQ
jgi:hypothetical protein